MSTVSSSFSGVGSNFTNSSSSFFSMSNRMVIPDEWKDLAQQVPAIDAFCNAWAGESLSGGAIIEDSAYYGATTTTTTAIWNHAMTKTLGWMMVMLFKTIFLEERFDRWSGAYRFLNLGSTLFPFGMATWAIYSGMGEHGGDTPQEPISNYGTVSILAKHLTTIPAVRQWLVSGLAWALFHRMVLGRIKATKIFTALEWIPGILSAMISLACWLLDETTVAARLLGGEEFQPNTLFVFSTAMRWAANTVTAWYCYAVAVQAVLGTKRFTSFSWFLVTVVTGKIALSGYGL